MNKLIAICFFLTISSCGLRVNANRGDNVRQIWESLESKKIRGSDEKVIRRPRHHKWRLNEIDSDTEPPTTTTPAPITKSPEQIQAEKEEEMRRINPKGFLTGKNGEKIKIKLFGTPAPKKSLKDEIKNMDDNLKSMQTKCETNADCTNRTCCFIDEKGIGACILKPHQIGQHCTDMCACVNDLECITKEIDQDIKGVVTTVSKCSKKLDERTKQAEFLKKVQIAVKKSKGCSAQNCKAAVKQ